MSDDITPSYTWKPDVPDYRDQPYVHTNDIQPDIVDLRSKMPQVYNQGMMQSCTAHALAGQLGFLNPGSETFSRLFIYYGERAIEGTVNVDAGAQLRDGIRFLANTGCCPESIWPYDKTKWAVKPINEAYVAATPHKILAYSRLSTLDDMLDCLAAGYPFVFGMAVYTLFERPEMAASGVLQMPIAGEKMLGGHAVEAVGYNMITKRLLIRNSWGTKWGQSGHFTMPFDYVTNRGLTDDFWTIRK